MTKPRRSVIRPNQVTAVRVSTESHRRTAVMIVSRIGELVVITIEEEVGEPVTYYLTAVDWERLTHGTLGS